MFKLPSGRAWSGCRPASKWSVPGSLIACPALTRHKCIKINSGALEYPKKKLFTIFQVFFFVLSLMEYFLFIRVIFNHIYSTWVCSIMRKNNTFRKVRKIYFWWHLFFRVIFNHIHSILFDMYCLFRFLHEFGRNFYYNTLAARKPRTPFFHSTYCFNFTF